MSITNLLSTVKVNVEINDAKQYTTTAPCFDGRDDAPVQCRVYCPIEGVQGFTRSHWTLPRGKYLLHIIPEDNGVACKKKRQKEHYTCWPFRWPWWCASTIQRTLPDRGGSGLQWKPLVDATGWVLQVIVGNRTKKRWFSCVFFHNRPTEKGRKVTSRPLITIEVWHVIKWEEV